MDEVLLKRRLDRERAARREAEQIAEAKTRELYETNERLHSMNERLQELVDERTMEAVKARDEAIAASRAKSVFLANMSHELRTPLNSVIGYSEMILEEHLDLEASLAADVKKIHAAGKHLLLLINDVLDISKIEAGRMTVFREDVEVQEIVRNVVETISPLPQAATNKFEWSCAPDVGHLQTDVVKLRQILFNLLSNAFKFTSAGQVSLRVWRDGEAHAQRVWFEVRDTGIGISPQHMGSLFTPFSQGDPSTTRRFGGTGLGLALSQKFALMLGGDISGTSEEGRGSTFRFYVPDEKAESPEADQPPIRSSEPEEAGRIVLAIDDDLSMHEMLRRYLAGSGFRVVCTGDAEQALALARQLQPVAITLDILMPRRDGWSVLADLKASPDTAEIPVILVSILDERGFGLALGAADYLMKPVSRTRLIDSLRRHAGPSSSVLVVEDESALRALMVRALAGDGWDVREAENGKVALELVAKKMPGAVVLDLMMPEVDGFAFLAELHRMPGGRDVPVVVVTAKELTDDDITFFKSRASAVLQKAVYRREELLQLLVDVIDRSSASIARRAMDQR